MTCPGLDLEFQGRCISPSEQQQIGPSLCRGDEVWDPNAMVQTQGKTVRGACRRTTGGEISAGGVIVGVTIIIGLAYLAKSAGWTS